MAQHRQRHVKNKIFFNLCSIKIIYSKHYKLVSGIQKCFFGQFKTYSILRRPSAQQKCFTKRTLQSTG
ncbi:hypothetical protein QTP88_011087 [Uroleucon formosanum]